MTFKKDPAFTPHAAPPPAPTASGTTFTKRSTSLDVRSTVSDPIGLDPTTTIPHPSIVPSNTTTPVPINTPIKTTEAFKNAVNNIIEAITYLTASLSYGPKTVLLQLAEL